MKERGLICNQRTVLAILAGATQDRRPIKGDVAGAAGDGRSFQACYQDGTSSQVFSPFGVPGDRLYVRETMQCIREMETGGIYYDTIYSANGEHFKGHERGEVQCDDWFEAYRDWWNAGKESRFIPSIHMPRWASRINLLVKRVWVERVQDISEADAIAEGIISDEDYHDNAGEENLFDCPSCQGLQVHGAFGESYGVIEVDCTVCDTVQKRFSILMESIYGPGNPWVWACEFEILSDNS